MTVLRMLACFTVLLLCSSFSHPFYVSITQGIYAGEEDELQLSIRLFTDDISEAIDYDLYADKNPAERNQLLEQYLQIHFQWGDAQGNRMKYEYLGLQREEDIVYIFLKISKFPPLPAYAMRNSLLTDIIADQKNLVNLQYGNKKAAAIFTAEETHQILKME